MKAIYFYEDVTVAIRDFVELENIDAKLLQELRNDPEAAKRSVIPAVRVLGRLLGLQRIAEEEAVMSEGRGSQLTAAKALLRVGRKENKPCLTGAWVDAEGRQCIASGYHAVRLLEPLGGLPALPDHVEPMKLDGLFKPPLARSLELPTVAELRMHQTREKTEHPDRYTGRKAVPVEYDFGPGLPLVDAQFLMDLLQLLPGCSATWSGRVHDLIQFTAPGGDGILCPLRKKEGA